MVTGTLAPDATGGYRKAGLVNGRQAYSHVAGTYGVWWLDTPTWFIGLASDMPGPAGPPMWHKDGPGGVEGEYTPLGGSGNATVTLVV